MKLKQPFQQWLHHQSPSSKMPAGIEQQVGCQIVGHVDPEERLKSSSWGNCELIAALFRGNVGLPSS
jgi:hypothetical protein